MATATATAAGLQNGDIDFKRVVSPNLRIFRISKLPDVVVFENHSKILGPPINNSPQKAIGSIKYEIDSPSDRFLTIRAAISRIAHMSGAGRAADKFIDDMKDTSVLAEDGTDAKFLETFICSRFA